MRKLLIFIGIISLLSSSFFFYESYDKYNNYMNSENYSMINENVYVGGDAYNYIINSNYFSGFNILGIGTVLLSFICFGFAHLIYQQDQQIRTLEKISNKTSNDK